VYLVIGERGDASARWAAMGLASRGLAPLRYLTADDLRDARTWDHRIGVDGASFRIELADGSEIASDRIVGCYNRLQVAPLPRVAASPGDAAYAQGELQALLLSALQVIRAVLVNAPTPRGPAGPVLPSMEWRRSAAAAGLATIDLHESSREPREPRDPPWFDGPIGAELDVVSVVVIDRMVIGRCPAEVKSGAPELARILDCGVLGLTFGVRDGRWQLSSGTATPDLVQAGTAGLDALAGLLIRSTDRIAQAAS